MALLVNYVVPDQLTVTGDPLCRAPMPPMSLGLLKAMTPGRLDDHDLLVRCWDEVSMGPYDVMAQRPDILCLSALTTSAARAYRIVTQARDVTGAAGQRISIAMGGIHATALPHEALAYVDAVALGETAPSTLRNLLSWLIWRRGGIGTSGLRDEPDPGVNRHGKLGSVSCLEKAGRPVRPAPGRLGCQSAGTS